MAHKTENIHHLALYGKIFQFPIQSNRPLEYVQVREKKKEGMGNMKYQRFTFRDTAFREGSLPN